MADKTSETDAPVIDLARFSRVDKPRVTAAEVIAASLTVFWFAAVALFFLFSPTPAEGSGGGPLTVLMTLLAIFLPVALIWVAAVMARTVRSMREEAAKLQSAIDAMRHAYLTQQQSAGGVRPSVERKLDEIAAAQRQTESALATFASRRDGTQALPPPDRKAALAAPRQAAPDEQPALALGTPAEEMRAPLSVADFISALNFPDSPDDKDGFRALRRALEDRQVAKLIRAAQDVLNLLSEDGIYMDDLRPDRATAEAWRRFGRGERGRTIAALGGVRDRSSLALAAGRMKQDPIFRDAAHHFLRQFDRTFSEFEKNAGDEELIALSDTRTARAFMLLGRVTGTFD